MESLKNVGQITPIVVTRQNGLIAGRRRLEAARRLGWSTIRVEYFEDLSPLDRKIVEFDENDKRRQLTWQESARAIKEIHDLKRAAEKNWTASDTARALGFSLGKVSEDLALGSVLDNIRVTTRPSRRGALEAFKKERELVLVRELARRRASSIGLDSSAAKSSSLSGGVIYNDDCIKILTNMLEDSVDLVIIDPPWGIDFDKASQWSTDWISTYDDREETVRKVLVEAFPLLFKVLKPAAHIYCFYPVQEVQWWTERMTQAGFSIRHRPLIWFKPNANITNVYTSFLPRYESILWGYKPAAGNVRRLFANPVPEAQSWPTESTTWHENSKPVEMLKRWIEASSEVNEIVLDAFSGGGSTLVAAFSAARYYIGVELDEVNYIKSVTRLRQLEEGAAEPSIETSEPLNDEK